MKRAVALFFVGALVGTLGDRIHTYWDVLGYPHPTLFEEPWWVPPQFGLAAIVLVLGHTAFRRRSGEGAGGSTREVATAAGWFAAAYLASGVFKAYPVALTVAFVAAFVARALSAPTSRVKWLYALATAVGGTLYEAGLSATGAFAYLRPHLLGVPLWLPGLYLHAALLTRAIDRRWPG